jgi:Skp family chaperone for outer membrane proteins
MRYAAIAAILFGTIFTFAGCGTQAQNGDGVGLTLTGHDGHGSGGVAVIDLDEVAKRLGRDVDMVNSMQQAQTSLNQQLANIQTNFQKQFEDTKKDFGEQPTDEQQQHLTTLGKQINGKLNETVQQARNNLSQHRVSLINRFREEVKPTALAAASERGLSVVATKNDTVIFAHGSSVDITDRVVELMLARAASKPAPAAAPRTAAAPEKAPSASPADTRSPQSGTQQR